MLKGGTLPYFLRFLFLHFTSSPFYRHDSSDDLQESTKTFKIRSRQLNFNLFVTVNEKKIRGCLWLTCGFIILEMKTEITVFPRIITRGDYFLFRAKRRRLFEGGDYFQYCLLEVVP